ncbi:MAG: YuzB family protein [Alicyclobacillus herbarius]|uniref:DUF1450 domain-containing protein n=1 Tax=Alicyclobacillus herbarius TaxID=122960 RepID=UPI002352191B|nr:DUF1450 domain-containing protein [Alicyclobacillus herbarius]MCL6631281.1 YuzB family protein [Alicyclobacillus herbarius]
MPHPSRGACVRPADTIHPGGGFGYMEGGLEVSIGGFILIEVCDANPACVPELFQLEEAFPGVSVLETSCLSECDLCAERPYVFFNAEIVSAMDVPTLLEEVKTRIQEHLELYNTEI